MQNQNSQSSDVEYIGTVRRHRRATTYSSSRRSRQTQEQVMSRSSSVRQPARRPESGDFELSELVAELEI